jgi:hypothetical protein
MGTQRAIKLGRVRVLDTGCRTWPLPSLPSPKTSTTFRQIPHRDPLGTDRATKTNYLQRQPNHKPPDLRLVSGFKHWNRSIVVRMVYKGQADPVIRTASPAPLAQDFVRQQVSKQQRSNYHSSSLSSPARFNMVSRSVNKTGLHPAGVQ